MKRILLAALMLGACVPASEPAPPAGAAGFATQPSAASRGEPFTTRDGWTLRFEHVAFAVEINSVNSVDYAFDARDPVELWVPGLPTGPVSLSVPFAGAFGGLGSDPIDLVRDPFTSARLHRPANDARGDLPSVVLAGAATKGSRTLRFDLVIAGNNSGPIPHATIEVKPDALTLAPVDVRVEDFFVVAADGASAFEPFAQADRDGDGNVTVDELRAAIVPCSVSCDTFRDVTLLDVLEDRAGYAIVAR